MNNLLYSARMALRDIYEVNVFTKGTDRVYLSVSHDLEWDAGDAQAHQDGQRHAEQAVVSAKQRLGEMDSVLVGGDRAVTALMGSESVEIVRKTD